MIEVYYYIPSEEIENAVHCGLKLSRWFDREVRINGESRKCLTALLNPRDDMGKYGCDKYECVKLQVLSKYCFVADSYLYQIGLSNPAAMELYHSSIMHVEDYTFGLYRLPECLVTSTIVGGYVSVLGKELDSPILFDNSEELYLNNIMEAYQEEHTGFINAMLYCFYSRLEEMGMLEKLEDAKKEIVIFSDKTGSKRYTLKIPNMDSFVRND